MGKVSKVLATGLALLLTISVVPAVSTSAASYSSKNVTLVNANSKAKDKEVKSVQITFPSIKKGRITIYRGTKNVSVQLKTKVTVVGKGVSSSTKKYNAVTYKTSNPRVVSVSSTGKLTAKRNGTATITVTSAANTKRKATMKVTVASGVGSIKATVNKKYSVTLNVGKTANIKASVGNVAKGGKKSITYTSENTKIAVVDSKGKIIAKAPGTTYIKVTPKYSTGVSVRIKVVVNPILPTSISASNITLNVGQAGKVNYKVSPSNTTNKGVIFQSSNASVVTVDRYGNLKAIKAGSSKITIISKAKSSIRKTITVTVKAVNPTSIRVSTSNVTLETGQTKKISWTFSPTNTSNKGVSLYSSNSKVATLRSDGTIQAHSPGEATLTITSKENAKVKATVKVVVNDKAPKSIHLLSKEEVTILVGDTNYKILYEFNTSYITNKGVVFESSDDIIASVDKNGVVIGHQTGTACITVRSVANPKAYAEVYITVEEKEKTQIVIADSSKKEFTMNSTITVKHPKTLFEQMEQVIKENLRYAAAAGIQVKEEYSYQVELDGVTYTLKYVTNSGELTILKEGINITEKLTDNPRTIHSVVVKVPRGLTVSEAISQYAEKLEKTAKAVDITVEEEVTIGNYTVSKLSVRSGYVYVTVNGVEHKFFVDNGELFMVGAIDDVQNINFIKALVDKGYITLK